MKKMISALLIVTVISIANAGYVHAQINDKNIAFIPAKNYAAYVSFVTKIADDNSAAMIIPDTAASANNSNAALNANLTTSKTNFKAARASFRANKANSKALKNFNAIYKKEMPDATWSVSDNSMIAYFSKDGVKTQAVYNKRGNLLHTLTYYPADKTPSDIASAIDDAYPKDNITVAVKVEEGGMQFYIVQLEGKTTLKKVTVYNGEVNQIEELIKSNYTSQGVKM